MLYNRKASARRRKGRAAVAVALFVLPGLVLSGDALARGSDVYCARISEEDHVNSKGEALESVGAIIRQDRANYHSGRHVDRDDQGDALFDSAENRAFLEQAIDVFVRRAGSPGLQAIFDTNPRVCIEVDGEAAIIRSVR